MSTVVNGGLLAPHVREVLAETGVLLRTPGFTVATETAAGAAPWGDTGVIRFVV